MITISSKLCFQKPIVEGSDVEKFAFYNFAIILYNFQNLLSKFSSVLLFNQVRHTTSFIFTKTQQKFNFDLKIHSFQILIDHLVVPKFNNFQAGLKGPHSLIQSAFLRYEVKEDFISIFWKVFGSIELVVHH
jgi:hypothetical protein